jgi:hypothetical protein
MQYSTTISAINFWNLEIYKHPESQADNSAPYEPAKDYVAHDLAVYLRNDLLLNTGLKRYGLVLVNLSDEEKALTEVDNDATIAQNTESDLLLTTLEREYKIV